MEGMWRGAVIALMAAASLQAQQKRDDLHQNFYKAQGSRFTVHFEGGEDWDLANRALDVLGEAYERIRMVQAYTKSLS